MEFFVITALLVILCFVAAAWWRIEATHHLVNSRMDEFKKAIAEANLVSMAEFRKALTSDMMGVLRGPPGPKGEKGEKGK